MLNRQRGYPTPEYPRYLGLEAKYLEDNSIPFVYPLVKNFVLKVYNSSRHFLLFCSILISHYLPHDDEIWPLSPSEETLRP